MTRPATKALNKPLLIVGLDSKRAGLAFLLSVIVGANDGRSKIAAVVSSDPLRSVSDLQQFKVLDALEMSSVPRKQRQRMSQSNTGNQAVTHADLLPRTVKLAANICRVSGGNVVQRQHDERLDQLADCMTAPIFTSTTQKLKTAHSRRLELICRDVFRNLILHRLDTRKEIDQDIRVGNDHRQLSRSSFVVRRSSSPSFFESDPPSDNRILRRFFLSTPPCKKLSIASPSTAENPFCPRRDARASKALRCSGFISTVVLIYQFYMHVHVDLPVRNTNSVLHREDL
jgi:hypothetical protein